MANFEVKVFVKVHCGETDEKQNPGQRMELSAFSCLRETSAAAAAAVVTESDGGRGVSHLI